MGDSIRAETPRRKGKRGMEVDNAKFLWFRLQQYRCQLYIGAPPLPLKPKRFI
jgi:hypothetical protein